MPADRHAQPDTTARVWAEITVGQTTNDTIEITEARQRAFELARSVDDPNAFLLAAGAVMFSRLVDFETRRLLAEEVGAGDFGDAHVRWCSFAQFIEPQSSTSALMLLSPVKRAIRRAGGGDRAAVRRSA